MIQQWVHMENKESIPKEIVVRVLIDKLHTSNNAIAAIGGFLVSLERNVEGDNKEVVVKCQNLLKRVVECNDGIWDSLVENGSTNGK